MSEIEYFYSDHSAFAYLGSTRFMAIAKAADRAITHRPIDPCRIVPTGGAQSFNQRSAKFFCVPFPPRDRPLGRGAECPGNGWTAHLSRQ